MADCQALPPLQRLHLQLQASITVADVLLQKLQGEVGEKAIVTEMQVDKTAATQVAVAWCLHPSSTPGVLNAAWQLVPAQQPWHSVTCRCKCDFPPSLSLYVCV